MTPGLKVTPPIKAPRFDELRFSDHGAGALEFRTEKGCVLKMMRNGEIEIGEAYTPSEAADEFLAVLAEHFPHFLNRTNG